MAMQPGMMGAFSGNMRSAQDQVMQGEMQQAANYASLGLEGRAALAGGQLGKAAGNIGALAMGADPEQLQPKEVVRAKKMQKVQEKAQEMGLHMVEDPEEFYNNMIPLLGAEGLADEAAMARTQLEAHRAQQAAEYGNRLKAEADLVKAQADADKPTPTKIVVLSPKGAQYKGDPGGVTLDLNNTDDRAKFDKLVSEGYRPEDGLPARPNSMLAAAIGEMAKGQANTIDAIARMEEAKKEGGEAGKAKGEQQAQIHAAGIQAYAVDRELNQLEAALTSGSGSTEFGSFAEVRYQFANLAQMYLPEDGGEAVNNLLKMDPADYEAADRASKNILVSLATTAGFSRPTNMLLKTLENAGPAVTSTNEGMRLVTKALRKRSNFDKDKARYVAEALENGEDVFKAELRFEEENSNNQDYFVTREDQEEAKRFVKWSKTYSNRLAKAARNPAPKVREGNRWKLDRSQLQHGSSYKWVTQAGDHVQFYVYRPDPKQAPRLLPLDFDFTRNQ